MIRGGLRQHAPGWSTSDGRIPCACLRLWHSGHCQGNLVVACTELKLSCVEQVYVGESGIVASRIISDAYTSAASMSTYTISSNPYRYCRCPGWHLCSAANCCGHSYKSMTSTCYCASPPDNCGAGYDAGAPTCIVDNSTAVSPTLVFLLFVLV